jgi:thiosulfate/3-mercaptopyruvate sulfurtransferase
VPGFTRPELIATPDWLAENLGRADLRVLDLRWRTDESGPSLYAKGHLPGAVHVDWRAAFTSTVEGSHALLLAQPDRMAAAMANAGIGDGTTVVVYDDTLSYYAARAWWSLRAYGFESVRILDGGLPAWVEAGHQVVNGEPMVPESTFTPRANASARLTTADVRGLLGSTEAQFIDARAPAEYHGYEGNVRRLGHIPGAVNLPVGAMHTPGTQRLREPDALRDLLLKANVTRSRRLACYDGSGVSAAKLAWILTLLGHEDVAVYDGGWTEWGDRLDLPVDR